MRGVGSGIKEFKDAVKEEDKKPEDSNKSETLTKLCLFHHLGISSANLLKIIILMTILISINNPFEKEVWNNFCMLRIG